MSLFSKKLQQQAKIKSDLICVWISNKNSYGVLIVVREQQMKEPDLNYFCVQTANSLLFFVSKPPENFHAATEVWARSEEEGRVDFTTSPAAL